MKNKFKYIVIPCIFVISVIFLAAYGTKINFGGAWFKDSLPNGIVPNKSIRMQPGDTLYYNGVPVTSGTGGGGIAASDNTTFSGRNTFQYKTIFSDTLKADGLSLIDNARITSDLNVTGDIISDLNFLKGSSTSIGTISTDSLAFITNNTKRIVINKNGYTNFTDTVQMSDYVQIIGNLNVGTNITSLGKVTADSLLGIGYYITDINAANIASGKIDSARIPNTAKIDTAKFAHTDTLTTESVRSVWTFWNIVRCIGVVTFDVSPVFNAAVNFANGITVTGTATFNGDLVPTSWVKTQSSVTKDQYIKDKFVRLPISTSTSAGTVTYALHGIGRTSVRDFDIVIRDDSTGRFAKSGNVGLEGGAWAQGAFSTWGLNDTAVWFRRTANAYNFIGDTAFFHIIYADTTR